MRQSGSGAKWHSHLHSFLLSDHTQSGFVSYFFLFIFFMQCEVHSATHTENGSYGPSDLPTRSKKNMAMEVDARCRV